MTEIAAVLDRRRRLELAGLRELLLDIPKRSAVGGRIEKSALERRHGAIDGAFTPTWDAGKGILGGGAKSGASRW